MNVVEFPSAIHGGWQIGEQQALGALSAALVAQGDASGFETGAAESGAPQFYILGPSPDHECVLCVSRVGRLYVVQDTHGEVLLESGSLTLVASQLRTAIVRRKTAIVARLALIWCMVRETFEERLEPVLGEPVELLGHFAPQLAAIV